LIGLDGDACEIYEITVETIGFFDTTVKDFNNPRIAPHPGQPTFLASSETLAQMLSPKRGGEVGSAHIGSPFDAQRGRSSGRAVD
jgi:hypothetical protein